MRPEEAAAPIGNTIGEAKYYTLFTFLCLGGYVWILECVESCPTKKETDIGLENT